MGLTIEGFFKYHGNMKTNFNSRGNGACPFCRKLNKCPLRKRLSESLKDCHDPEDHGMEIVIYTCPLFEEDF